MAGTDLSQLFNDLRRLTAGKAVATISQESDISGDTLKPWLRPGYTPKRRPPKENYEALVKYVDRLRAAEAGAVTNGDHVSRETTGRDLDDGYGALAAELAAIRALNIDPTIMGWMYAEAVAGFRAIAMTEAERARLEAERAAGTRASAVLAAEQGAQSRARIVRRASDEDAREQAARERGQVPELPAEEVG